MLALEAWSGQVDVAGRAPYELGTTVWGIRLKEPMFDGFGEYAYAEVGWSSLSQLHQVGVVQVALEKGRACLGFVS